jgi:hypothetical protein
MPTGSDTGLSPAEAADLRRLAGTMIPPSATFDLPGADDPAIFADILRSLGRDADTIREALSVLAATPGARCADLDDASAGRAIQELLARGDRLAAALGRVVLQCYYRDDRVLRSLGHEPRSPFPQGHALEQGDWSLLDAVRTRPQLWRDDRRA